MQSDTVVDFLGIGAQKSTTSLLWHWLRKHPDIWLPPRKELHYFDRDIRYPAPSFLHDNLLEVRLTSQEPHNKMFRLLMAKELNYEVS